MFMLPHVILYPATVFVDLFIFLEFFPPKIQSYVHELSFIVLMLELRETNSIELFLLCCFVLDQKVVKFWCEVLIMLLILGLLCSMLTGGNDLFGN